MIPLPLGTGISVTVTLGACVAPLDVGMFVGSVGLRVVYVYSGGRTDTAGFSLDGLHPRTSNL